MTKVMCFSLAAWVGSVPLASAYLGGFETEDGYADGYTIDSLDFPGDEDVPIDTLSSIDVTRYNAGESGINNGGPGGVPTDIPDNTGAWTAIEGGMLYADQYDAFSSTYIVKHSGGYLGGDSLDLYNNFSPAGAPPLGDLHYEYAVDDRDLDGVAPTLMQNDGVMDVSFWLCPWEVAAVDNIMELTFVDQSGIGGLTIGYTGDSQFQYRLGNSAWVDTGVQIDNDGWSQIRLHMDFVNDTAEIHLAGDGGSFDLDTTSMGVDMANMTTMDWRLNGRSEKNLFDEFDFIVTPEPSGALLAMLAAGMMTFRRRRS